MSWDLDAILKTAGGTRDKPQLVEVGTALIKGRASTAGYFWSNGRIGATAGPGWVRIDRRLGVMGDAIRLEAQTLAELADVCVDWTRRRASWAAFYYSSAGYPPGYGGYGCYYQAPGAHEPRITVGRVGPLGHNREGDELVGTDHTVAIDRRVTDVTIVAELWRRGEKQGPVDGSLVGLRYALTGDVYVDARRNGARVHGIRSGDVTLEPGDEAFVAALLDAVKRRRSR